MPGIEKDFIFALLPIFAEIIAGEDVTERIQQLRFDAVIELQKRLNYYESLGYMPELLTKIAEKKGHMILSITTKTEMKALMNPRPPRYDGGKFIPDKYMVPEEELICWSATSLRAPLNSAGFERYSELFKSVFPEQGEKIFG